MFDVQPNTELKYFFQPVAFISAGTDWTEKENINPYRTAALHIWQGIMLMQWYKNLSRYLSVNC